MGTRNTNLAGLKTSFRRWISTNQIGHCSLYATLTVLTLFAVFGRGEYETGVLDSTRILEMMVVFSILGAALGSTIWFLITKPLLRRRGFLGSRE